MSTTYYTTDHEWLIIDDGVATIGISDHAQQALGDIVFVDLPEVGRQCEKGEAVAVVESVKAASDVYSPVAGEVVAVNEVLHDSPETVNESPEVDGWFMKVQLAGDLDKSELMDAYAAFAND